MAENLDSAASNLLCAEDSNTCFDDLDCNAADEFGISFSWQHQNNRSESLMGFPLQTEEIVGEMVEREGAHLPRDGYLKRWRIGDLDLTLRTAALDWISKACAHYRFGPLSICLSMNYLDRFLSVFEFPRDKVWVMQLLAVACLSLAAKMEEPKVPESVDLQVGEPKYLFEARTIQKMELLVLTTLNWKMQAFTPCSFIDYFLSKISEDKHPPISSIDRSVQLALSTIKGIDFLEFRPSEIAAAVAISVSGEMQPEDIDKAVSGFVHVKKGSVLKCVELIKDLSLINGSGGNVGSGSTSSVPQSPNGVLDATCLSYKTDDITVGSCANSSQNNPDIKRRKQHRPSSSEEDFKS